MALPLSVFCRFLVSAINFRAEFMGVWCFWEHEQAETAETATAEGAEVAEKMRGADEDKDDIAVIAGMMDGSAEDTEGRREAEKEGWGIANSADIRDRDTKWQAKGVDVCVERTICMGCAPCRGTWQAAPTRPSAWQVIGRGREDGLGWQVDACHSGRTDAVCRRET
jgi:hypothetical protein